MSIFNSIILMTPGIKLCDMQSTTQQFEDLDATQN